MNALQFYSLKEASRLTLPWPDVYFSPHYGSAVEQSDSAEWEVAVWAHGPIVYPYLKRNVDSNLTSDALFDIVSPYGYVGTWAPAKVPVAQWRDFRQALRAALRERGCVAEFQRLSALVPGRETLMEADETLEYRHHNNTVSFNVTQGYECLWNAAEGRSRTKTRKAMRLGYRWTCHPASDADLANQSTFRLLYHDTMQRAGASPYYFFTDDYFRHLLQGIGGRLHLLEVLDSTGETVIAGLYMEWGRLLHLHLVGSTPESNRDGAGNLAYDGLIQWACDQDRFDKLHVGGGMQPGDRMFYFKQGFGGDREPFWICRGIVDPGRYNQLAHAAARRLNADTAELLASDYFPCYRSGKLPAVAA